MGREGWPKGRKAIKRLAIENEPQGLVSKQELEYDVAGYVPCMPLYCAGEQECMINVDDTTPQPLRVVTICVALGANAGTSSKAYYNYGTALISLAETLQVELGVSVEIIGCFPKDGKGRGLDIDRWELSVTLKQPDQPLDIDALAFAFACSAFHRRVQFKWLESQPELSDWTTAGGYGYTPTKCYREPAEGTVMLNSLEDRDVSKAAAAGVAECTRLVETEANRQLQI